MAQGKKYREAPSSFDREPSTRATEALSLVKSLSNREFDESVDVVARLGVDPRKADQMVRGTVGLPAGTGKDVRVAVFAQGDEATAAREAGADVVGAEDLVARIEGGLLDFDVAIAIAGPDAARGQARPDARPPRPDAQPQDRHGHRRRRPRRSPSSRAARSSTAPTATATCTCRSARSASTSADLHKNFSALIDELERAKPASSKGKYLKKIVVSSTMGPGVKVDPTVAKDAHTRQRC